MNIRISLTTLSLVAASFAIAQAANANEGGGPAPGNSRFNFAPQTFRQESNPTPSANKYYNGPISTVRSGSVPTHNFLGIPAPAAPAPMPAAQPAPVMVAAAPKILPPSFSSLFGHPVSTPAAPKAEVAQAPRALPPVAEHPAAPAAVSKPVVAHAPSANRNVSGQLLNHKHAIAHSAGPAMAMPSKPVSSYGSGFGYQPGPTTVATGSGSSTSTNVSGVIVSKRH